MAKARAWRRKTIFTRDCTVTVFSKAGQADRIYIKAKPHTFIAMDVRPKTAEMIAAEEAIAATEQKVNEHEARLKKVSEDFGLLMPDPMAICKKLFAEKKWEHVGQ